MQEPSRISIAIEGAPSVSGLMQMPSDARACYIFAHGAGAGMDHPFMVAVAAQLEKRGIATLRFQFPYMERRSKRPDSPRIAQAAVRAAVAQAAHLAPSLPLFAGGKSFGGRMTSQAQASSPLPGVRGLAFLGFPLHAAGKPSDERARHLSDVRVPMLFIQGSKDTLADLTLLAPVVERLDARASLHIVSGAGHSFPVRDETMDRFADWVYRTIGG